MHTIDEYTKWGYPYIAMSCKSIDMHEISETQALREQGFRLTHQRRVIIDYVKSQSTHVTAEQIFAAVSRLSPGMSIATV